jgi:Kef-type K+ transport system membrane component KefB
MTLLTQVAVLLAATVAAIPLFRKLGLSSILGYLTAGIALGPRGLHVIRNDEGLTHLAELGVVLLLFVIGLELQPSRLKALRRVIFGLGSLQVLSTTAVFASAGYLLDLSISAALVVGFALSLSSTPLVLQLLAERSQLNAHHDRSSFAILLFQDIAVMPVLALLPLFGGKAWQRGRSEFHGTGPSRRCFVAAGVRRPLPVASGVAHGRRHACR